MLIARQPVLAEVLTFGAIAGNGLFQRMLRGSISSKAAAGIRNAMIAAAKNQTSFVPEAKAMPTSVSES